MSNQEFKGKESGWLLGSLAAGILAGAGLMYLMDPASGRGRRAKIREKGLKAVNQSTAKAGKFGRHLMNRGEGLLAKMRKNTTGKMEKMLPEVKATVKAAESPSKTESLKEVKSA
jgi:hypothetical protein